MEERDQLWDDALVVTSVHKNYYKIRTYLKIFEDNIDRQCHHFLNSLLWRRHGS